MLDPYDIPDLLSNLVDRSLVVVDQETWRYELTESMRAFLLEQDDEDFEQIRRKHAEFAAWYAERVFDSTFKGLLAQAQIMYDQEAANIRAAFEWGMVTDPKLSLHIAACVCTMWHGPGVGEARLLLERALEAAPEADDLDHAWARLNLASHMSNAGKTNECDLVLARVFEQKSIDNDPRVQVMIYDCAALSAHRSGDGDRSQQSPKKSLAIAQKHDLKFLQSNAYAMLGELARGRGDTAQAEKYYQQALGTASNDSFFRSIILLNLAYNAISEGHIDQAEQQLREALRERRKTGSFFDVAVGGLGLVFVLKENYETGGLLLGYLYHLKQRLGTEFDPADAALFDPIRAMGYEKGGPTFAQAFEQSRHVSADQLARIIGD